MAVWALRVGYTGLAVGLVGLIVLLSGSTPWILAVGVIIWLAAAVVTVTGVFRARHELPNRDLGTGRCGSCSSTTPSTPGRLLSGPDGGVHVRLTHRGWSVSRPEMSV
jgi:hypothetical protein